MSLAGSSDLPVRSSLVSGNTWADAADTGGVRIIALVNLKSGSRNENEAIDFLKKWPTVKQIYIMGSAGFDLIYESLPDGTAGVVHMPSSNDEGYFPSQAVVPSETQESPRGEPKIRSAKGGSRSATHTPLRPLHDHDEVGRSRSCVDGKLAEHSLKAQRLKRLPVNEKTRLIVVGGDGSMNWVLSTLDELGAAHHVMPVPFGTGNDLARSLGWGNAASPSDLAHLLPKIEAAETCLLDRWQVDIFEEGNVPGPPGEPAHPSAREVFTNCFSIGHDAKLTLDINTLREEAPRLFPHRSITKAWYVMEGVKGVFEKFDFSKVLSVKVDGRPIQLPQPMGMLILSNIDSYADGLTLWRDREKPQDFGDGLLEVVALEGPLHLALSHARIRTPLRLGQGKEVRIKVSGDQSLPMQTDGEPWLQRVPCELCVTLRNKVPVLVGPIKARQRAMSVSEGMGEAGGSGNGSRGPTPPVDGRPKPSPVKAAFRDLMSRIDADVSARDFLKPGRGRRSPASAESIQAAAAARSSPDPSSPARDGASMFSRLRNSFRRTQVDQAAAASSSASAAATAVAAVSIALPVCSSDPDPTSNSDDESLPASPSAACPSPLPPSPSVPPPVEQPGA